MRLYVLLSLCCFVKAVTETRDNISSASDILSQDKSVEETSNDSGQYQPVDPAPILDSSTTEETSGNSQSNSRDLNMENGAISDPNSIELPECLTVQDFKQVTSEKISFVEFFSPHCVHCKQFAPTWESTYKSFYPQMEKLGIQMRQVDCISSGDLCEKEEVFGYPSLRIYIPKVNSATGENVPGESKFVSSFPRSVVRTEENLKKYMQSAVADYGRGEIDLPSSSKLLSAEDMLKLAAGDIENLHFVMFSPSSDEEWAATEADGLSRFKLCGDTCFEAKQDWDVLSNQVLSVISTGHVNCVSHSELCEKFGFHEQAKGRAVPSYVAFAPKSCGRIRFDFQDGNSLQNLKEFILRLNDNYRYELVTSRDLSDVMEYKIGLPNEPLNSYYPLSNQVAFVYYFDSSSDSPEDRAILSHILDTITKLPFNVHIYTSKSKRLEADIFNQGKNIINFVNTGFNNTERVFNENSLLARTLTWKPTILAVKENTLFTNVYQNFATLDLRDRNKVIEFVERNQFPLYGEMTYKTKLNYFKFDEVTDRNSKVVIFFIDSTKPMQASDCFYNISLVAHDYHLQKTELHYSKVSELRDLKDSNVEDLKKNKAKTQKILSEMAKSVPHNSEMDEVLFAYINLSDNPSLASEFGWNISGKEYKPGDAIVVERRGKYYWDTGITGEKLTTEPKNLKLMLEYFLEPSLVLAKQNKSSIRLNKKLVNSPYGETLRFMDYVHERGLLGYMGLFLLLGALYTFRRQRFFRRGKSIYTAGVSILPLGKIE